ncbi:MAG: PD40 domain-containing protein [Planctomycetes bacterium]|nr:PD40 domain-containing protein [Planctomycetota bacterium]
MRLPSVSCVVVRLPLALAASVTAALACSLASAQTTTCDTLCVGAGHPQAVADPQFSADGRWLAFASTSTDLVPGDSNGSLDVFVADLASGAFERVSVATSGAQGNFGSGGTRRSAISGDGRFVAFLSTAMTLDPAHSDYGNIYVRDRLSSTTSMVPSGLADDSDLRMPRISDDGTKLAFVSFGEYVAGQNPVSDYQVWVHDFATGTTELASQTTAGQTLPGPSGYADIGMVGIFDLDLDLSPDGRFVVFGTYTDLFPSTAYFVLVVRDLQTSTTRFLPGSHYRHPKISSDGTLVIATGYDGYPNATKPGSMHVIDVAANTSTPIPLPSGATSCLDPLVVAISRDARYVLFSSPDTTLVTPDANGATRDLFVLDRVANTLRRVNESGSGVQGALSSGSASMSGDGARVAFLSTSTVLAPEADPFTSPLFVRSCAPAPRTLCAGDGSGTACPCGNSGASGHGCANSLHAEGALFDVLGTASVTHDSLALRTVSSTNSVVLYFQSTEAQNGGAGVVLGDGLLCVSGSILRLGQVQAVGGASQYPGVGQARVSLRGQIPTGGGVSRVYQSRYRNVAAFCTPESFNVSNGVVVDWLP